MPFRGYFIVCQPPDSSVIQVPARTSKGPPGVMFCRFYWGAKITRSRISRSYSFLHKCIIGRLIRFRQLRGGVPPQGGSKVRSVEGRSCSAALKSEDRRPKPERRPKSEGRKRAEIRRSKPEPRSALGFGLRISALGFLSAFGFRASGFKANTPLQRGVVRARWQETVSTVSWLALSDRAS